LYIADQQSGLRIVDVSDPPHLRALGNFWTSGSATGVDVVDNRAFLVDGAGMQIVDVSDATAPALLGTYSLPGAQRIQVVGALAYVTSQGSSLQIIDVGDPAHPIARGTYVAPTTINDVKVAGGRAYLAAGDTHIPSDFNAGMLIVDVHDPAATT